MYDDGCSEICVVLQAMHKRLYLVDIVHKDQEKRMKPARNRLTFIVTKTNKAREEDRFGISSHSAVVTCVHPTSHPFHTAINRSRAQAVWSHMLDDACGHFAQEARVQ